MSRMVLKNGHMLFLLGQTEDLVSEKIKYQQISNNEKLKDEVGN